MHRPRMDRVLAPGALVASLLGVVLLAAACGGGGGGGNQAMERGHEKFLKVCATCHGKDAHGMPKLGKDLHDNAFVHSQTDDELVAFIKHGRPATDPANTRGVDMPPKGGDPTMTDDDLRNIVAFLRTL